MRKEHFMNELQIISYNGMRVVDSREVAEMVGKPHNDLLKSIRAYCEYLGQGDFSQSDFFIESTYRNSQNKEMPCYLLTKKGCDMVANKLTGEKGVLFTAAYVTAFEEMTQQLNMNRLPPEASAGGVADLIRITRRVLLESGSTPQDVRQMSKEVYQTYHVPVPTPLQYPAQLSLLSMDNPQAIEGRAHERPLT